LRLFGFEIKKQGEEPEPVSFAPPVEDDGAVVVAAGGVYGTYVDLEGSAKSEAELVTKYRDMLNQPEVDQAVDDIVNEAIVSETEEQTVSINLDEVKSASPNIKKAIQEEFENILKLLNFRNQCYEIFRRYYVDGRLYYHAIINEKDTSKGLVELRYIDPRKIRKVKEIKKRKDRLSGATITEKAGEYFLYSDKAIWNAGNPNLGMTNSSTGGIRIAKDSIIHVVSGLMDTNNTVVLSHLHKAIKVLNQLRTLEDATVIYRISRAPERRIFYIDVGNLPKIKAEQYLKDVMNKYRNKIIYDSSTGEIKDDRKFMSMLEDYWLPRREGGRGTEITTLPGGDNLGQIDDINYFKNKLYQSLNVPVSRLESSTGMNFGRAAEINRDELKFGKFIDKLRKKFNELFQDILRTQLILKGILTDSDWSEIKEDIFYIYAQDRYYAELKNAENVRNRIDVLTQMAPFIGTYFSKQYVMKNILQFTDEDIEKIEAQIQSEGPSQPPINNTEQQQ